MKSVFGAHFSTGIMPRSSDRYTAKVQMHACTHQVTFVHNGRAGSGTDVLHCFSVQIIEQVPFLKLLKEIETEILNLRYCTDLQPLIFKCK